MLSFVQINKTLYCAASQTLPETLVHFVNSVQLHQHWQCMHHMASPLLTQAKDESSPVQAVATQPYQQNVQHG
jgi:hypothetical protein